MDISAAYMLSVGQIIWIDLLLSGDNAVVIALACRSLPDQQRRWGIIFGAGAAITLRILFALVISQIMLIPFLMTVGGVLLLWIAIKLLKGEEESEKSIPASEKLWHAIRTVEMIIKDPALHGLGLPPGRRRPLCGGSGRGCAGSGYRLVAEVPQTRAGGLIRLRFLPPPCGATETPQNKRFVSVCRRPDTHVFSWIEVGKGFRPPRPPNRTGGFSAYGSPVGGFHIGSVLLATGCVTATCPV